MITRKLLYGGILAAAAAVPYVATNKDLRQKFQELVGTVGAPSSGSSTFTPAAISPGTTQVSSPASSWSPWNLIGGTSDPGSLPVSPDSAAPAIDYAEILRFDLPPEYVLQRWPRVSIVAGESGLTALRVPLVTGPQEDDLAGSLTYSFDNRRQLQRIVLQGQTGDPRRIVSLVTRQHDFQQLPSLAAGLYVCVRNNQPQSLLQINYAPVVQASQPHQRSMLILELNRPGQLLSDAGRQLLQQDKQLSHW